MDFKVILHIIGFLLLLTGSLMFTAIPFSIYYKTDDIPAILISGISTSFFGFMLWFLTRKNDNREIKKREGYLIVSLGWIVMSLFGTLPFIIYGSIPSFTDAFFETMSGFTTTGASILTDIEALPHGLLFWRSMTHWIGGMGIIVLSLAILPILGIGGMQLYQAEVAGPTKDKIHPRVRETAKRLWGIYVILTGAEAIFLMIGGMNLFESLCHSFATLATGGFSPKNASIAFYQSPFIEYVIIVFMFLGGTNFALHYFALHGRLSFYFKDSEFRFYFTFILITVGLTTLYLFLINDQTLESAFRHSAFSIMTILSSTGFVTVDYEKWAPFFTHFFLFLLLFGACAGSTSGGVKMVRYQLLLKNSLLELKRLIHPSAVLPVRQNGRTISPDIITKVAAFVLMYLAIFGLSSLIMSILGLEITSAMGSVAACMGNIGPGLGSTGPVTNFSSVPDPGKWLLSFDMLLGRLELYTVLMILRPSFWRE
ncbi:MAG: potassium transporter [Ignavibacteria bacterium GWB2_36_8]|nr:MAG: potassium transporter [Ignavibacteria bacterium GWB2_36_8]